MCGVGAFRAVYGLLLLVVVVVVVVVVGQLKFLALPLII